MRKCTANWTWSATISKVDEMPFDFSRRRMSVVVAERDQRHLLICKGAVEEILAVCTTVRRGEASEPLSAGPAGTPARAHDGASTPRGCAWWPSP